MATDEEKHLEVMTAIKGINTTIEKVLEPAVDQTYKNKEDITKIQSFQSTVKWVGCTFGLAVIFTTVRGIWTYITRHHQ